MDNGDNVLQSEKGAEAAWRGFSTQTLYIAGRLLECDDNELEFYPEQVEDLLVKKGKSISELASKIFNIFTGRGRRARLPRRQGAGL